MNETAAPRIPGSNQTTVTIGAMAIAGTTIVLSALSRIFDINFSVEEVGAIHLLATGIAQRLVKTRSMKAAASAQ